MSIESILRQYGGRGGGLMIYNAAKGTAKAINLTKKRRPLNADTKDRLDWMFPNVDLDRVRVITDANLPANWFVNPNTIDAMTFGWEIYTKKRDLQYDYSGLRILIHELVHVRQIRDLGEGEFARRYGEQWLEGGGYPNLPIEQEAYNWVTNIPFNPTYYLSEWSDVNASVNGSDIGALCHWFEFGVREGRRSMATFDISAYLAKNQDLIDAGFDHEAALRHWLEYGHAEGRPTV